MNKSAIKELIAPCFTAGVASVQEVCGFLKYNRHTLNSEKNKGKLKQIDRGVFAIDDVVNWLFANPRYLSRVNNNQ